MDSESKHQSDLWDRVRAELEKGEMSANKVAVLESEKIFLRVLEEKGVPGQSAEEKIKGCVKIFSNPDKLRYSRAMHDKLMTRIGFDISPDDTREIIKGYREAVQDLENLDYNDLSAREKIRVFFKQYFGTLPRRIRGLVMTLAVLSLSIFFLSETSTGQAISRKVVGANNYIYYHIIPTLIFLTVAGSCLLLMLYVYQKKKK